MLTPNNSLSSHANSIPYKQHCFEFISLQNHPMIYMPGARFSAMWRESITFQMWVEGVTWQSENLKISQSPQHTRSTQFGPCNRGPGPTPGTPVSQLFTPPPPRERRENNFYWSHLPGDWQTSGAVLRPGHVSQGGLRRGRGVKIAGSQA